MDTRNLYGEALSALDDIPSDIGPALEADEQRAEAQRKATIVAAKASLALCDAIYDLRNHIEELKGRLPRE